jgi:hypothetical protein
MFGSIRPFTDSQGMARFEEVEVVLEPHGPAPGAIDVEERVVASSP